MRRIFMVAAAVLFCAATASAQNKVSGTTECGKPDPQLTSPVGDRPDHTLAVAQEKCTWAKPLEIGGDKSKDGISTGTFDVSGDSARARGFSVTTMKSGDKFFVWYEGSDTGKEAKGTCLTIAHCLLWILSVVILVLEANGLERASLAGRYPNNSWLLLAGFVVPYLAFPLGGAVFLTNFVRAIVLKRQNPT